MHWGTHHEEERYMLHHESGTWEIRLKEEIVIVMNATKKEN